MKKKTLLALAATAAVATAAHAEPVTYQVEPTHTFARWAHRHLGISTIRGQFDKTAGKVVLDRAAKTGTVDIQIDVASVNTGVPKFNDHLKNADFFDVEKFPTATYRGRISKFNGDAPAEVDGELTLHGVTKPLKLVLTSFKCLPSHPFFKVEVCGADATASFDRRDFGMNYAVGNHGSQVDLAITIEALRQP